MSHDGECFEVDTNISNESLGDERIGYDDILIRLYAFPSSVRASKHSDDSERAAVMAATGDLLHEWPGYPLVPATSTLDILTLDYVPMGHACAESGLKRDIILIICTQNR